jgi:hypothetical protein
MKRFKRILRLLGFVILIFLASLGIGLSGGVPIPPSHKKEDVTGIKTELFESDEEKT